MPSSGNLHAHPLIPQLAKLFSANPPPVEAWEKYYLDRGQGDDGCSPADVQELLAIRWGEFERRDFYHFVIDLTYGRVQRDVFNYLYPGFLVFWWQCLRSRTNFHYFYTASHEGKVYEQMIQEEARSGLLDWVVRAFVDAVDVWSGQLSSTTPDGIDLHALLEEFNSLGQILPVTERIWERLCNLETAGRAQWWLVLATGIAYTPNTCPFIRPFSRHTGGGGVILHKSSGLKIPYLSTNLEFIRSHLTIDAISQMLDLSTAQLPSANHRAWIQDIKDRICDNREFCNSRLTAFLERLGEANLGMKIEKGYPDVVL